MCGILTEDETVRYLQNLKLALAALVMIGSLAWPVAAQMSSTEQKFVEGLQKRGMLKLVEIYLDEQSKSGGDPSAINEQLAGLYETQGARSADERERDELFSKATKMYHDLISQLGEQMKTGTDDRVKGELRMHILTIKVHLGEMLWQREATNQLTSLELTDREAGDRKKVQTLLREATTLFEETNKEATAWAKEIGADPEYEKHYGKTDFAERTEIIKQYSLYQTAWTAYYLAFALPDADKEREKLLKEAITRFEIFTAGDDAAQAKWESFKGLGMCNRELGKPDAAVENLRKALGSKVDDFKVSVYYELTQTYLRAKRFVEARQTLDELRAKKIPNMEQTFVGGQLLPYLDAKITLAEGQTDPAKKEAGLAAMRALWERGGFWRLLVAPEVGKYIDKTQPLDKMKPFELWILADAVYGKAVAKEADKDAKEPPTKEYQEAIKYFEQYIKIVPPTDPGRTQAQFNVAACYYKLGEKASGSEAQNALKIAANMYKEVAKQPGPLAGKAALLARQAEGLILKMFPSEESMTQLEASYKDLLTSDPKVAEASDTRWYLAQIQRELKKYREAADNYGKVTSDSPNYYTAMFEEPLCYRDDLVEVQWPKAGTDDLKRLAATTVAKMEAYVNKTQGEHPQDAELKQKLRANASKLLVMAGEILASDRVQQYQRGLDLVGRCEKEYPEQTELAGAMLKVKIDCLMGQNQLEKAGQLLQELAKKNPKGLQAIFQTLFAAITDEVGRLIGQSNLDEARKKVVMADKIGTMFTDYIVSTPGADSGAQIEVIRFQLAELHLKAEDLSGPTGAIDRYKALIGFDPIEKPELIKTRSAKQEFWLYLLGLARSSMMVGQKALAADPPAAYKSLKAAAFYWSTIAEQMQGDIDPDSQARYWDAKLNELLVYYDLNDLEQKFGPADNKIDYQKMIKEFIVINAATKSKFGGPEKLIQFRRLAQKVGADIK
jgi:tetratricopeptide (TPR) repeat protein